jgi:hypothetical protein
LGIQKREKNPQRREPVSLEDNIVQNMVFTEENLALTAENVASH